MAKPLPVDYLQPEESVIHQGGRHGLSVLDGIIGMFVLMGLVIAGMLVLSIGFYPFLFLPLALPVIIGVTLLFLWYCLLRYWRVTTTMHTVTDERVYYAYGRLRFNISQTTYDKLTDIHIHQSFFGRIYGFGTLRLETAGTGLAMHGVHDPFGVKQQVEDARSAFIRSLVGDVAPAQPTFKSDEMAPPKPLKAQQTLWSSRPSPASLIGNMISIGVFALFVLASGIGSAFLAGPTGGMAFILPAVMAIILVLLIVSTIVTYRYTIFEVGSKGVVVTRGWLSRQRVETTYAKVTDVMVYQSLFGRMLGYGNITINTAGSNTAPVVFTGVPDPEGVKRLIDEQRDA